MSSKCHDCKTRIDLLIRDLSPTMTGVDVIDERLWIGYKGNTHVVVCC